MNRLPLLALALVPLAALANNPFDPDSNLLPPVVVTATRTPRTLAETPVATRIVGRSEIELLAPASVQELLQAVMPDIEFGYAMNQQPNLMLQGFEGNSVLILVDGERLAGETLNNIDYARINPSDIERVEVVKGAASALYGTNAAGAVINIITRKPDRPWQLSADTRLGTQGEQRAAASLDLKQGRWESRTVAAWQHQDALHLCDSGDITDLYATGSLNLQQRFQYSPTQRVSLGARAGYFYRDRQADPAADDRYRDLCGGLQADISLTDSSHASLSYAYDEYDKSRYSAPLDLLTYSNVQHIVRGLYSRTSRHLDIDAGAEAMSDYLMSHQFATSGESHRQYSAAAFAQADWQPNARLEASAALRYDYTSDRQHHLSPRLNLRYRTGRLTLRAAYAHGFRAPTMKERYMNFDMAGLFTIHGNPALNTETADHLGLTAEYTHKGLSLTASAYHNRIANRIGTLWSTSAHAMFYANQDAARVAGIDATASYAWDCGLGARLSYTFTHERFPAGGVRVDAPRPHAATFQLNHRHAWRRHTLHTALNGRLLSAVTNTEAMDLTDLSHTISATSPAYMLWDLHASWSHNNGLSLTLALNNLLNYVPDRYYTNSPVTTGFNVVAGISFTFR